MEVRGQQKTCLKKFTVKYILGRAIQFQGFGLIIFSVKIRRPHNSVRFLDLLLHQEVPKLFSQQQLRGVVDKTTAQQSKVQQFETTAGKELNLRKIFC